MVRRYADGYRKTDQELKMDSKNCTELEEVITRCMNTRVKNEWAKMAKMERRLKWFNLKVNEFCYFDGSYHFLLTKQKNCLLLHFSKLSGFSIEIVLLVHFITSVRRCGNVKKNIWLTKLNFKSLTDSRVGYKVIKIRLLILHLICIQIVFKIKALCSKIIE